MASNELPREYEELRSAPDLPFGKNYHIFVCYTRENLNEVCIIVENLEKEGYRCCYYERDFTAGQSVLENTDQAMNKSLHMLVILSEDLSTQPFVIHEIQEARHKSISDGYSIIPIKIEPCTVPECLKSITWIEASDDDVNCMHDKIIDAVVRNDIASGLKYPSNGETSFFFCNPGKTFAMSLPRFRLEIDPMKLLQNELQLTMEDKNDIETILNGSFLMKNMHIIVYFTRITLLVCASSIPLIIAVLMLLMVTTLGRNAEDAARGSAVVFYTFICSVLLMLALPLAFGACKKFGGFENVIKKGKEAIQRRLWKINRRYKTSHLFVLFQHNTRCIKIIKYNTKPCRTYLLRRCEKNEKLKDKLDASLPIEEAIDVLFDNFLRNDIQSVDRIVWPTRPTRHFLKNGAQCLCMQIEQYLSH
ncbi:uncharacterized protein LOC128216486 [Mya arenaria]|uniref:uncharacterized protein LOC128216486 n=1 Tax=Mya arenaria TaxID=6604 RepID=UPI0022E402FC|nr:uncharacterized protein LOC128216486 [Mya arenaria]